MTYVKWPGFDSSLVPCVDQDPEAGDGPGHDALLRGHRLLPLQRAGASSQPAGGEDEVEDEDVGEDEVEDEDVGGDEEAM